MLENYMLYPTTVNELATEIIKICNDYKARKLSNTEFTDLVIHYASKCPEKLFAGPSKYNTTVTKIIGVRRVRMLDTQLASYQPSLLR